MADYKPNDLQQKAINILDGQVMLLVGQGTGKTFTIIERIKYMLSQDIGYEKMRCLTHTYANIFKNDYINNY